MNSAEASCVGKVSFYSFTLASAVTGRRNTKRHNTREAYHCEHCKKWHLGTSNRAEKVQPMRLAGSGHSSKKP